MLFVDLKGKKWYKNKNQSEFQKAFNIDVFGNYQFADFWNLIFSNGGYKFGSFGETISSVLGKKLKENTLSFIGYAILLIIDFIDISKWKSGVLNGTGFHCVASIQTDQQIKDFIN